MAFHKDQLFYNSIALTTTGNSPSLLVGPGTYDITIDVKVVSGTTPTLDLQVKESDDDSTYYPLADFKQITAKGEFARRIMTRRKYLRITHTITGTTPSFTITGGPTRGQDGVTQ